ncbi:YciI family protein [Intrasporangium sp.]|uniref:YciI family protein n=1 Tax=Intrasporangium sp. TaxID=1925024 RepID=UPI00293A6592|nr:YciI family protein [Intrasporangium sp.]MDV3220422.1 YciI family protein [Intrasporangium sp.]
MTQYLLAVHHRDGYPTPGPADDMEAVFAAVDRFNTRLQDLGKLVFAGGLVPPDQAKVADGTTVTDGPYSEAKEVLGGFWVIEAASLDEALDIARDGSVACANPVEVRAFQAE